MNDPWGAHSGAYRPPGRRPPPGEKPPRKFLPVPGAPLKGEKTMPTVNARSIKITIVLDAVEVFDVLQQTTAIADARVPFAIEVEGRKALTRSSTIRAP